MPPRSFQRRSAAASVSWMALLAATTLGASQVDCVRAEIATDGTFGDPDDATSYRLIVQSYAAENMEGMGLPGEFARPIASSQRAVTPGELRAGVAVDVLGVGAGAAEGRVLVAWVEPGAPDLEYDARQARPAPGARYGVAQQHARDGARVVLSHTLGRA